MYHTCAGEVLECLAGYDSVENERRHDSVEDERRHADCIYFRMLKKSAKPLRMLNTFHQWISVPLSE